MPHPIDRSQRADRDLLDHYAYIHPDSSEAAERFLDAAWAAFLTLGEQPNIGRPWPSTNRKLSGVRVLPLPRPFEKYLVFYRGGRGRVRILSVLHGARDLLSVLG